MKTTRMILLAVKNRGIGELLKQELERELHHYQIHIATNCNEVETYVSPQPHDSPQPEPDWLLIEHDLPVDVDGNSAPGGSDRPLELVRQWQRPALTTSKTPSSDEHASKHHETSRRCIVFTGPNWRELNFQFHERLLGTFNQLQSIELRAVELADMIDGSDSGQPYVIPLVLDLEVKAEKAGSNQVSESWSLRFRDLRDNSPMRFLVENLEHESFQVPKASLSRIPSDADPTGDAVYAGVLTTANSIGRTVFDSQAFRRVVEIHNFVLAVCWRSEKKRSPSPPFVQLHIHCNQDGLDYPLDIAVNPETPTEHLISNLPVVWHVAVANANRDSIPPANMIRVAHSIEPQEMQMINDKGHFAAATSCSQGAKIAMKEFHPIPGNMDHLKDVTEGIRWDKEDPMELANREHLKNFLSAGIQKRRKRRYLLTHGWSHRELISISGVVIGDDTVTIEEFQEMLNDEELGFFFVNCCDLGHHAKPEAAEKDYFGSFVAGAITIGVAAEVIGHRWSVEVTLAMELAKHFFKAHPRTVHSRATALFHAKRKVRPGVGSGTRRNLTWLAPIHVIRQA